MSEPLFRRRRPNQDGPPPSENEAKGWLVERVTQWIVSDFPGLRAEWDQLVKTTDGEDEAQVDVLLVPKGLEHRRESFVVIECKNEAERVNIDYIRSFIDKLDDLGVPSGNGWYVSVNGFTSKARRRARAKGVRTFCLTGIESTQRLKPYIYKALHSVVYLVADFGSVFDMYGSPALHRDVHETLVFFDDDGNWKHVLDYIYEAWADGRIKAGIGTHVISFTPPFNWYRIMDGEKHPASALSITVEVTGHVHVVEGEGHYHELVDVEAQDIHSARGRAEFRLEKQTYYLREFKTEKDLQGFMRSDAQVHLVQRVRVPRIRYWQTMYWPPSERVAERLTQRLEPFARGLAPDPRPFNFLEVEGRNVAVAWEAIAADYLKRVRDNSPSGEPQMEIFWSSGQHVERTS